MNWYTVGYIMFAVCVVYFFAWAICVASARRDTTEYEHWTPSNEELKEWDKKWLRFGK